MLNKKKTFVLAMATVAVGASLFVGQAKASSSWKEYFSQNEADSLKKYVAEYIREQMKNNNKDWKGVISAKELDNGTINADKVDNSVTKKKVITLKINSLSEADKTTTTNYGDTIYWKKVSIPEINTENSPNVIVYEKETFSYMTESLGGNYWKQYSTDFYPFTDGQIWIHFHDTDDVDEPFSTKEFKIVVNY